jgi:hypothetical protein
MPFRIDNEKISNKAWSSVDKSAIWQRLKAGLEEDAAGTADAIKEMYAVVKAPIDENLTEADCWGPHHEITGDGTLILNRGGLAAAAAALAGSRAEPNLTDAQKAAARTHLRRHYIDLELPLPSALGEISSVTANISSEMSVNDIPIAKGVNLDALKAGDDDPLEVVVEIPAGKSKRGWEYTPQVIQKIAGEVASRTATGFLGHQKPEDIDHEFPAPVTHWVGAKYENGKAYIRGVIDAAAKDLKRWIKAGRVRQVSIYGIPTLQQAAGETKVTDYELLSIDWTPLDRAGMNTGIVAMGEMADFIEVKGEDSMTLEETLKQLKQFSPTMEQVAGEMGWKIDDTAKKAVGEIADILGVSKDKTEDIVAAVKAARQIQLEAEKVKREATIDKVIGEMVAVEEARPLVKRLINVADNADEEAIRKAVGEMLEQEDIKKAIGSIFKEEIINPKEPKAIANMAVVKARI